LRTLGLGSPSENLVICGPSGTGKPFWLEGLGQLAVEAGLEVAWFSLEDLRVMVRRHRADEDKLVQRATSLVINAVYGAVFAGFLYGTRTGRNAHPTQGTKVSRLAHAIVPTFPFYAVEIGSRLCDAEGVCGVLLWLATPST
jgi:hypothetical protein